MGLKSKTKNQGKIEEKINFDYKTFSYIVSVIICIGAAFLSRLIYRK